MHGNVWEWCWDYYSSTFYETGQQDPTGPLNGSERIFRGGCWNSDEHNCRSARRDHNSPTFRYYGLGFRVVRTVRPDIRVRSYWDGEAFGCAEQAGLYVELSNEGGVSASVSFDATVKHFQDQLEGVIGSDTVTVPAGQTVVRGPYPFLVPECIPQRHYGSTIWWEAAGLGQHRSDGGVFAANDLDPIDVAEGQDTIDQCDPVSACKEASWSVVPILGSFTSITEHGAIHCLGRAYEADGDAALANALYLVEAYHLFGSLQDTAALIAFVINPVVGLGMSFRDVLTDAGMAAVVCAAELAYYQNTPAKASFFLTGLQANIRSALEEAGVPYRDHLLVLGDVRPVIGMRGYFADPDSSALHDVMIMDILGETTPAWAALLGEDPTVFGEEQDLLLEDMDAVFTAVSDTDFELGLLHGTSSGEILELTYPTVALAAGDVVQLRLREGWDVPNLAVDRLGEGSYDEWYHAQIQATDAPTPLASRHLRVSPNPFNPRTTIRYSLPQEAEVTLEIYDVAGHRVRSLVAGQNRTAGEQREVWDGKDDGAHAVPAGTYFCRLAYLNNIETQKMAVVK